METPDRQVLFDYYNERAPEYEEFYWGIFPKKIINPDIYKSDTLNIQKLLPDCITGNCIDVACGTGFWLPVYEKNCSKITLIDQSASVLAECAKKIQKLGIESKTELKRADIYKYHLKTPEYYCTFIGFLISHLSDTKLDELFTILKKMVKSGGICTIIDSSWNRKFTQKWGRSKEGMTKRILSDGREFNIYKRYFNKQDLYKLAERNKMSLKIIYWGNVFFLATGVFNSV
jgi:ubiquinone/menaquinone biosynthesis C-methylase UbiE